MDFQQLASRWRLFSLLEQENCLRQPNRLLDDWLASCQAWINGGPSPDDHEEIQEIIDSLHPQVGGIARVYIECARLFRSNSQWTSRTVETDALRSLHTERLSGFPHLPLAFLLDVADALRDRLRPPKRTQTVLFPLVWKDQKKEPQGKLARFVLERLAPDDSQQPESGRGEVFLDPRQSFVKLDDDFSAVFAQAAALVRRLWPQCPTDDVRIRIEHVSPADQVINEPLQGNSGGGALALGLWSVWTETPLNAEYVTSFALTAPGSKEPVGQCHPVGGLAYKAREVAAQRGEEKVFLAARSQPEDLEEGSRQWKLCIERAESLREAAEKISGLPGAVLAYLDSLVAKVTTVPGYYPEGAQMERVRVRVRVSTERTRFDPYETAERERQRIEGVVGDDEGARAYLRPVRDEGGEEEPRERVEVKILDWEREVHGKIHRGVVVGDPGLGKTWLLKREAAEHAKKAAQCLRENGALADITIPIYCRLADIATALQDLEEGRKPRRSKVPIFVQAVMEAFGKWELPSAISEKSRPLSKQLRRAFRKRLGTERAWLLLDAFDEIPDIKLRNSDKTQRSLVLETLGDWVKNNRQTRVLFSSRGVGYEKPPWPIPERSETEREMELLPFNDEQTGVFVDKFFAKEPPAARELRDLLRRAVQLRGLAQIPLLLGFLCTLHHGERNKPADERLDLTRARRSDLYEAVLRRLLSGQWRRDEPLLTDEEVEDELELLELVAFQLFVAGKEQFTRRHLRECLRTAHSLLGNQPPTKAGLANQITAWSKRFGVLVKAGVGNRVPYLFLHLTFQEYLTACRLANLINADGWDTATVPLKDRKKPVLVSKFLDGRAWLPSWQEVIVLLAGKLDDPVPLLELLADESKDDLFHHRLALAARCLPEIQALLDAR